MERKGSIWLDSRQAIRVHTRGGGRVCTRGFRRGENQCFPPERRESLRRPGGEFSLFSPGNLNS